MPGTAPHAARRRPKSSNTLPRLQTKTVTMTLRLPTDQQLVSALFNVQARSMEYEGEIENSPR